MEDNFLLLSLSSLLRLAPPRSGLIIPFSVSPSAVRPAFFCEAHGGKEGREELDEKGEEELKQELDEQGHEEQGQKIYIYHSLLVLPQSSLLSFARPTEV